MKNIWIKKCCVLCLFIIINLFACQHYWRELIHDSSIKEERYGEVLAWEWGVEQAYQNIVAGKNPFAVSSAGLYPFGTDLANADTGDAFYFVLLRPWLSTHQAMSIIVALTILTANIGMYYLLSKLKISNIIAIIVGLAFGYTTYLQPRAGHLSYMPIYVFPWFWWAIIGFWESSRRFSKILYTVGVAIFLTLALYQNQYYFVMLAWSVVFFSIYSLIWERSKALKFVRDNWSYGCLFGLTMAGLLSPWLVIVVESARFEGLPVTEGWGGAIGFSSDLFGYFIPSIYSKYLGGITTWFATKAAFARGIFENFSYPGILILVSYAAIFFLTITHKLKHHLQNTIRPWLFVGICFWVLTLGPFLTVAGRWTLSAPEGIKIVIPLPFAIFHYLPFMANIRSPARLTIAFILFSSIITAYLLDYSWLHLKKRGKIIISVVLMSILYIDHSFIIPPASPTPFPGKIYETVRQYSGRGVIYEMPSVVRDGFKYFGSVDSLTFIAGQYRHGKSVLAGYNGRVSPYKREYYQNNPFLGYMGRLMDAGVEYNGAIDRTELPKWQELDLIASEEAIDLLDIKYTILQNDDVYSASAAAALKKLSFSPVVQDVNYTLWERELSSTEYLETDIGVVGDDIYLGIGWRGRDENFRWATNTSSIIFKISSLRDMQLTLSGAAYYTPQICTVYINKKLLGKLSFTKTVKEQSMTIPSQMLQTGINIVHIKFPKSYQPSAVDPSSSDESHLSAKFTRFQIKELANE